MAIEGKLIACCVLAGSAQIGDWLLRSLSIGLPAFRIAGGLLLFSIASEMVFGVRTVRQSQQAEEAVEERDQHCRLPARRAADGGAWGHYRDHPARRPQQR